MIICQKLYQSVKRTIRDFFIIIHYVKYTSHNMLVVSDFEVWTFSYFKHSSIAFVFLIAGISESGLFKLKEICVATQWNGP